MENNGGWVCKAIIFLSAKMTKAKLRFFAKITDFGPNTYKISICMGNICKFKQYSWTLHNSIFYKL